MIYVVDTHALIWYLSDDPRLGETVRANLENESSQVAISVIVLAEIKHLFAKRKITLSFDEILERIGEDDRCMIYPFDLPCLEVLPINLDLHDGMIVATARILRDHLNEEVVVVTKDEEIKRSGLIPTIW